MAILRRFRLNPKLKSKIIFITGPTAVGKSEVALELAKKFNAEIISCDSMQIYKSMDIITSKVPGRLRKKVAHHLIDVVPVSSEYNVSRYRKEALKKIKEVIKRKRIPIFVGGTGLYISILVDGIFSEKPGSKAIRKKLYEKAGAQGSNYLHAELKKVDPQAAGKIHANDLKRIIRALEVFEATGRPISQLHNQRQGLGSGYDIRIFCLDMQRQKLYKKIEERVEEMFSEGLLREVRGLLGKRLSRTARYAIGINELKTYFSGKCSLEEAKELIKRNTRNYAKRQLTWFRKDKRIKWVRINENDRPKKTAEELERMIDGKSFIGHG